jgi:hypothetical protein
VSIETVEKLACDSGVIGIKFDDNGQAVDLGREQRLHTAKQRIMLAVRDGGCMDPDCDMPVSMTVVHHPTPWSEGGETSIDNGILLCDFDHNRYHELGYRIRLRDGRFWLIPPPEIDPDQKPILLHSKNPLIRKMQEETERTQAQSEAGVGDGPERAGEDSAERPDYPDRGDGSAGKRDEPDLRNDPNDKPGDSDAA